MTEKIVNGIYFKNPYKAEENNITEKVYENSKNLHDFEKLIDKYRKQLQPEFNVVNQSKVKRK